MIKMKSLNLALGIFLGAAVLSGCALGKMVKLAAQQDLQVDPNPLEAHGGKVPFTMSAVLPPKMLPSGKVWTIKTFYQYGDKEFEVGSVEFKAEDFPSSSTSTSRKSENFEFAYRDELNPGKVMIQGEAKDSRNGKTKTTPKMEVAQGIITTSTAVKDVYLAAYGAHGYNDKEELVPTNIDFFFPQGRSTLSSRLSVDGTSTRDKQNNLAAFIADKNVTRTVTITGTHSPEGTETINSDLSQDRAETIEKYYRAQMSKYDYKEVADDINFILKPVVQSWSAFRNALTKDYGKLTDDQEKQYLAVIDGSGTFEDKEKALRKLPRYKDIFETVYPTLRTAQTEILTVKPKKSNAEIAVLAKGITEDKVSQDTLNNEELLFAGTLTPSVDEKIAIYLAATKKSGTWVAHNNLAAAHLDLARSGAGNKDKLVEDALTQLGIAAKKKDAAEIHANMGSAYMMQAEYGKAYESLNKALEYSPSNALKADINAIKGAIEIRMANYDDAKTSFASASATDKANFDRGLAHLLSKDYVAADTFFGNATSSKVIGADAYYYKAVTAARRNSASDVSANLREAVKLEPRLKDKALADLEFSNHANAVSEAVR